MQSLDFYQILKDIVHWFQRLKIHYLKIAGYTGEHSLGLSLFHRKELFFHLHKHQQKDHFGLLNL